MTQQFTGSESKAFWDGHNDGLQWDLSSFDSMDDVRSETTGWDEATINACGPTTCAKAWGIDPEDSEAWDQACEDYNRGCYLGVTAPQSDRGGSAPGSR